MPTKSGMPTHQELRSLSESEIISRIDAYMSGTPSDWRLLSAQLFRDELTRRQQESVVESMLAWTRQVRNMTVAILFLTLVNVVIVLRGA